MKSSPFLDRQAFATLAAGGLLIAISFITNYGHGAFVDFVTNPLDEQIGLCLHLAALAALFSDVELATRLRHRARNREAEAREQAARRTRIQNGCLVAQCRFLLADTSLNRLQLSEALALLLEELRMPKA